jgi:hypothetical protein
MSVFSSVLSASFFAGIGFFILVPVPNGVVPTAVLAPVTIALLVAQGVEKRRASRAEQRSKAPGTA